MNKIKGHSIFSGKNLELDRGSSPLNLKKEDQKEDGCDEDDEDYGDEREENENNEDDTEFDEKESEKEDETM